MNTIIFPFDRVNKGASIAIYGAGEIGEYFLRQLAAVPYCSVSWLVDIKFESEEQQGSLVRLPPDMMDWQKPAQIVIASLAYRDEIAHYFIQQGVSQDKLVFVRPEQKIDMSDMFQATLNATPADNKWKAYYKSAEHGAVRQFDSIISPILSEYHDQLDYSNVLDFACGEGRIANLLQARCQSLQLVDASQQAIDFCNQRFAHLPHITAISNNAGVLPQDSSSLSFIYSWDAMVHFSYKSLDFYLHEFSRVLRQNGHVLIHHSNLGALTDKIKVFEPWNLNVGGRSNISKSDVSFIARKHGFEVVSQVVIDWEINDMDCISVLVKKNGV